MRKQIYFISFSILLISLCLPSCSEDDGIKTSSNWLEIYGRKYPLAGGVLWENNPNTYTPSVPFTFKDTYMDKNGNEVTDVVEGFTAGDKNVETGNFMITLFENGLEYSSSLQLTVGRASCICFHFSSQSVDKLQPGKYIYKKEKEPGTFYAYSSSDYDTQDDHPAIAEMAEGEVEVAQDGSVYTIKFNCVTTTGGLVKGEYRGELSTSKISKQTSAHYENLPLAGLLDTVITITSSSWGSPKTWVDPDKSNGQAFMVSALGNLRYAKDKGKEQVDISLVWDKKTKSFYFESPIRMRAQLWHNAEYDFPCHTVYMRAPNSFTDNDFDNLDKKPYSVDIKDEKVVFETEDFKPGYVFFKNGNGIFGVIKVKAFAPMTTNEITNDWGIKTISQVNPVLYIDVKCPAAFIEPQIR